MWLRRLSQLFPPVRCVCVCVLLIYSAFLYAERMNHSHGICGIECLSVYVWGFVCLRGRVLQTKSIPIFQIKFIVVFRCD